MKRFVFRLERVLAVRRSQASAERVALEQIEQRYRDLGEQRRRLKAEAESYSRGLAERGADHAASHLYAVEQFAGFVRGEDARLARAMEAAGREREDQRWRLRQAEQRCRLLEKLEEKQRAVWKAAAEKETDELAADVFLAQWSRQARLQRRGDAGAAGDSEHPGH